MDGITSKRFVDFIGIGLLYMWGSAFFPWINLYTSGETPLKIIGFIGAALVSISGIAAFFYTNDLESRLKSLDERNQFNEAEAERWREQAQLAISVLEQERKQTAKR